MWFLHGIQDEVDKLDEVEYNILCTCSFFFLEKVLRAFYQLFKMIHDHKKSIRNSCAYVIFGLDPCGGGGMGMSSGFAGQHQPSEGDTEW